MSTADNGQEIMNFGDERLESELSEEERARVQRDRAAWKRKSALGEWFRGRQNAERKST